MNKKSEYLLYTLITILWTGLIFVLSMYPTEPPNLIPPERINNTPTTNTNQNGTTKTMTKTNFRGGSVANVFSLIGKLMLIALIALIIYLLIRQYQKFAFEKSETYQSMNKKLLNKKIGDLRKAIIEAKKILRNSLNQKSDYTNAIIEAYHVIDDELTFFREASKPKYWTPKEYAFKVREPLYQVAVRGIVELFYKIRYGKQNATENDVKDFLLFLEGIFLKDLTPSLKKQIDNRLPPLDKTPHFYIPRVHDFTKPFKHTELELENKE